MFDPPGGLEVTKLPANEPLKFVKGGVNALSGIWLGSFCLVHGPLNSFSQYLSSELLKKRIIFAFKETT
jgi:hypothetical protein